MLCIFIYCFLRLSHYNALLIMTSVLKYTKVCCTVIHYSRFECTSFLTRTSKSIQINPDLWKVASKSNFGSEFLFTLHLELKILMFLEQGWDQQNIEISFSIKCQTFDEMNAKTVCILTVNEHSSDKPKPYPTVQHCITILDGVGPVDNRPSTD